MTHSDNSRIIGLVMWAPYVPCFVCSFFSALIGLSGISKWAYLDSSFSFLIHAATNFVAVTNFFNSCVSSYWCDSGDWHTDDMTHEVHLNAPMKSQFKQVNTPVADSLKIIEMFLLVQVNGKQTRWHRRNITVVENMFVVMIINSDPVYVVSSITKLLLLVIQISYLANLV